MSLTEFADRGFHSQSNTIEFYQVLLAGTHLVVLFQTLEVGGDEPVLPVVGRQAVDDDDGRVRMRQDERLDGAEREQRLALAEALEQCETLQRPLPDLGHQAGTASGCPPPSCLACTGATTCSYYHALFSTVYSSTSASSTDDRRVYVSKNATRWQLSNRWIILGFTLFISLIHHHTNFRKK